MVNFIFTSSQPAEESLKLIYSHFHSSNSLYITNYMISVINYIIIENEAERW